MMKSYLVTFVVLLVVVSDHVILSNKNDTVLTEDKFSLHSIEEVLEEAELRETVSPKLSKSEATFDGVIIPTTHRTVRQNVSSSSAQERDTKLMNLLAARRSALHRDRFRSHRRIVTTGRTKPPIETTSKTPPSDLRTICVRNCTKNFTRRTTASCMRQCTSIQRYTNITSSSNSTSDEDKSQKDNNEILFTDESSHGFFVVAKDVNDTMNHIPELKKSIGSEYKTRSRGKPNTSMQVSGADSYIFFGRKIPSLRPSFLSISTVSEEHPQILEVSVSQKPPRPKSSNKFSPRDRNASPFTRKLNAPKLSPIVGPLISQPLEGLIGEKQTSNTTIEKADFKQEILTTSSKEPTFLPEDITPKVILEDAQYSTATTESDFSTPLIISVIDDEETTLSPQPEYLTEPIGTNFDDLSTEVAKIEAPSHFSEDKTNLIIFVNKSMEGTPPSIDNVPHTVNASDGITVVKTTILSSVRSTVFPPVSTSRTPEPSRQAHEDASGYTVNQRSNDEATSPSYEKADSTRQSSIDEHFSRETSHHPLEESGMTPDTRRLNIATYVLAGLGMFPVLLVILYLAKSLILKRYSKHDEDFDVCITDQQPISPVKKTEKYDEEEESGQYDQGSIGSMDEFQRGNLRLKSLLGEGNFGQVWKAEADDLRGHIGATRIVAVKTVRSGSAQDGLKDEATIMRKLGSHSNVVTLLGACIESEPHMLIMEFAMRGRLLSLLRAARSATNILPASVPGGRSLAPLSPRTLAGFALDIAAGMEYIAGKRIVHRDLAARNVLIDHNGICKICDFGMSIDLDVVRKKRDKQYAVDIMRTNSNKFDKLKFDFGERLINHWGQSFNNTKKTHGTIGRRPALPIRWMAPESLQYNEFSIGTDVWAFGIVLWELATLGATPYSNLSGREVVQHVLQGTRPELPKDGRHGFFDLMSQCWHKVPDHRPTFREARLEIARSVCKWLDDDEATSDYMDVSGFSEDLEHGMVYFNQRISEFECDI